MNFLVRTGASLGTLFCHRKTLCSFEPWNPAYNCEPHSEPDKIVLSFRTVCPLVPRKTGFLYDHVAGERGKEVSPLLKYSHLSLCLPWYSQRFGGF